MQCYEKMDQTLEIENVFQGSSPRVEIIGQYLLEQQDRLFVSQTEMRYSKNGNMAAVNSEKGEQL